MTTHKDTLREEISEILVEWNMPTRQIAINAIINKFTSHHAKELAELVKEVEELNEKIDSNGGRTMYELGYKDAIKNSLYLIKSKQNK